jgi:hypothetical protein
VIIASVDCADGLEVGGAGEGASNDAGGEWVRQMTQAAEKGGQIFGAKI